MTRNEITASLDRMDAAAEYISLRSQAVALDPMQCASFNKTCERKAYKIVNTRLSAKFRYYIGAEMARKAKAEGRDYPAESLPTPADFVEAAKAQVEFLKWAVKNLP